MPWNDDTFTRTNGVNTGSEVWQDDASDGVKIRADRHDTHDQDLADGINACLKKDGSNGLSGSYTATATGLTTSKTITVYYKITNNMVFLETRDEITGTSNASTFTLTGAPEGIRTEAGDSSAYIPVPVIDDSGPIAGGYAYMDNNGVITFTVLGVAAGFTDSGTKGVRAFAMAYLLELPS